MAKKCKPNWKDLPKEVADLKEQIEQCCKQPSEQTTINGKSGDGIVISSTGGGGGGESLLKQVKVTVTPEQMLDLVNNPVELIPAQGEGTVINVIDTSMFLDFNSIAYNFPAGSKPIAPSFSMGGEIIASLSADFFNSSVNAVTTMTFFYSKDLGFNNPLLLSVTANATQGDSPVTFIIDYTVHNYN